MAEDRKLAYGILVVFGVLFITVYNINQPVGEHTAINDNEIQLEYKQIIEGEILQDSYSEDNLQASGTLFQVKSSNHTIYGVSDVYQVLDIKTEQIQSGLPFKQEAYTNELFVGLETNLVDRPKYEDIENFPVVTGASSNHFNEALTAIVSLQNANLSRSIYFYDLGLKKKYVEQLLNTKTIHYRVFEFNKYPNHVRNLKNYAFKALVWADMLKSHNSFLWIDASGRFKTCFADVIAPSLAVVQEVGIAMFHNAPHSTGAVTHPQMLQYLPTASREKLDNTRMMGANFCLMSRHRRFYEDVLRWLLLCSLDVDCIGPATSRTSCRAPQGHKAGKWETWSTYSGNGCHRYDQSALNVLLANYCNFDKTLYSYRPSFCMSLQKFAIKEANAKFQALENI